MVGQYAVRDFKVFDRTGSLLLLNTDTMMFCCDYDGQTLQNRLSSRKKHGLSIRTIDKVNYAHCGTSFDFYFVSMEEEVFLLFFPTKYIQVEVYQKES